MTEDQPGSKSQRPRSPDEDEPLVDRVLAGDSQAFEELVRRHEGRVYRTTLAVTGNQEDAEEAMQESFLKAYQHLGGFQRASRFSTWLTRIAVNEALQILRRRRPTDSLDELVEVGEQKLPRQFEDWHDSPEERYAKQEIRQLVEQAIHSLPATYRLALVLHDIEGLSGEEVAAALELSLPAAKSRILRARLLLREALVPKFKKPTSLKSRVLRVQSMVRMAMAAGK
jgi:RNA polymerase sigma-70 factor (ECF subfamily)